MDQIQSKLKYVLLTNKVLLVHGHAHLFTYRLWLFSHSNGRVEFLRQRPYGPQTPNVYYLAFYGEFSGPSEVLSPLLWSFVLITACILSTSHTQVVPACGGGVTGIWAVLRCHF